MSTRLALLPIVFPLCSIIPFLPLPLEKMPLHLDQTCIQPGWPTHWCNNNPIVSAASFSRKEGYDLDNAVVVGQLLAFSFPKEKSSDGMGNKFTKSISSGNKKRVIVSPNKHGIVMIFADLANPPNCFAIIYKSKKECTHALDNNARFSTVRIGDIFAFYEPAPTTEKPGNMCCLNDPTLTVLLSINCSL